MKKILNLKLFLNNELYQCLLKIEEGANTNA